MGILRGYSVLEIVWQFQGGRYDVEDLLPVPATRFCVLPGNELRLLTDAAPDGLELEPREKFVVVKNAGPSEDIAQPAVLRSCAWSWLFKRFSLKDWLIFSERYGVPPRIGRYPQGSSEADRKAAAVALENLGVDAWALLPEGFPLEKLETVRGGGDGDVHASIARFMDAEMSKSVQGQTLTTEQGDRGARSLGEVHADVLDHLVDEDVAILEEALQRQLVEPLVRFNFGDAVAMPMLQIERSSSEGLTAAAERLSRLVNELGLEVPAAHAYEKFGVPRPEGGEPVLRGLSTRHSPPAAPATAAGGENP
jgi:phage gp29-like protein